MNPAPLKPAVFYILVALAQRDAHGYAVMQAVREQSAGRVPIQTASLYRHLSWLIDRRWVIEIAARDSGKDRDPRRGVSYRLTSEGRKALVAERTRLVELLRHVDGLRPETRRGRS